MTQFPHPPVFVGRGQIVEQLFLFNMETIIYCVVLLDFLSVEMLLNLIHSNKMMVMAAVQNIALLF